MRDDPSTGWTASVLPVSLAVACAALAALAGGDPAWHEWFDYRRNDLLHGEVWRLVTGHLMHWSAAHAALDVAGLLLTAWIFAAEFGWRRQLVVCAAGVAAVDFGLLVFQPGLERYVGLSGLLHAWFAAGATSWLVSRHAPDRPATLRRTWGALLLVGLGLKLFLEARQGAFWLADGSFPVVTAAHRWGSAAGVACGLWFAGFSDRDRVARAGAASRSR